MSDYAQYPADEDYLRDMATVFDVVDAKTDTPQMQAVKKAYYDGVAAWRKQDRIEKCYLEMARKSYGWCLTPDAVALSIDKRLRAWRLCF